MIAFDAQPVSITDTLSAKGVRCLVLVHGLHSVANVLRARIPVVFDVVGGFSVLGPSVAVANEGSAIPRLVGLRESAFVREVQLARTKDAEPKRALAMEAGAVLDGVAGLRRGTPAARRGAARRRACRDIPRCRPRSAPFALRGREGVTTSNTEHGCAHDRENSSHARKHAPAPRPASSPRTP
jgi:hypothetical protein